MNKKKDISSTLNAPTFASTIGQAVWMMTMSEEHRDMPISVVESLIAPAIYLKQFRLYSKKNQPVAFLVWASVTDEVKTRIESGNKLLELAEWRGGTHIIIVECISPFNPPEKFTKNFLSEANNAQV